MSTLQAVIFGTSEQRPTFVARKNPGIWCTKSRRRICEPHFTHIAAEACRKSARGFIIVNNVGGFKYDETEDIKC
jgi:hypothetical protein